MCYNEVLPWYSRFFPYVALLQSLVLLASGSFWFHFPLTSARIEHFLAILGKCCESPWTSRALSHAARQENMDSQQEEEAERRHPQPPYLSTSSLPPVPYARHSSLDSGTDSPLLKRSDTVCAANPLLPCPSSLSYNFSMSAMSYASEVHVPVSRPSEVLHDSPRQLVSLDRSDGEQARALFERVRRFRSHCESSDVIYKVRGHLELNHSPRRPNSLQVFIPKKSKITCYGNWNCCFRRHTTVNTV